MDSIEKIISELDDSVIPINSDEKLKIEPDIIESIMDRGCLGTGTQERCDMCISRVTALCVQVRELTDTIDVNE